MPNQRPSRLLDLLSLQCSAKQLRPSKGSYTKSRGLSNVHVHLDNILVASHSKRQHSAHLCAIFNRLGKLGLKINVSKCERNILWGVSSCPQIWPRRRMRTLFFETTRSLDLIWPLRKFVDLFYFFWRFMPDCVEVSAPLTESLLAKSRFMCPEAGKQASASIKVAITKIALLAQPTP